MTKLILAVMVALIAAILVVPPLLWHLAAVAYYIVALAACLGLIGANHSMKDELQKARTFTLVTPAVKYGDYDPTEN